MQLNNNNQQDDIYKMLRELYYEVIGLKSDYMKRRMNGEKNLDEIKEQISELDKDFQSLAKSHTVFLRLEKASGVKSNSHSSEVRQKIQEIRGNIGKIVSLIPKENQ